MERNKEKRVECIALIERRRAGGQTIAVQSPPLSRRNGRTEFGVSEPEMCQESHVLVRIPLGEDNGVAATAA